MMIVPGSAFLPGIAQVEETVLDCDWVQSLQSELDALDPGEVVWEEGAPYTGSWPSSLDPVNWGGDTIDASDLSGVVHTDGVYAAVKSHANQFCVEDTTYYAIFELSDPQGTLTCCYLGSGDG